MIKKFKNVSVIESCSDRISAIVHSLYGLHRTTNPFTLYNNKLQAKIDASVSEYNHTLSSNDGELSNIVSFYGKMTSDAIERRIASLTNEISQKELAVEEAKNTKLFEEEEFSETHKKAVKRYEMWSEALGRPPYYENFDYRKMFKQDDKTDSTTQTSGHIAQAWSSFVNFFKKYANKVLYLGYPAEAYFALPAFQFITPENQASAYSGAAILVGCLFVLGRFSGALLQRSRVSSVQRVSDDKYRIISKPNFYNLTLLLMTITVAIMVVLTGTALRTMVFDVERNIDNVESLNKKVDSYREERDAAIVNGLAESEKKYSSEIENLQHKIQEQLELRNQLRNQSLVPSKADGYLALSIYLSLFAAPLLLRIINTDPYPEYQLVTQEAAKLKEIKSSRDIQKHNFVQMAKNSLSQAKSELAELQKQLDLKGPEEDGKLQSQEEVRRKEAVDALLTVASAWRKQRFITYFSVYMLLRGNDVRNKLGDGIEDGFI